MGTLVIVFTGAGASAPLGYPVMAGLNAHLSKTLQHEQLLLYRSLQGSEENDAETVFQAINLIMEVAKRPVGTTFRNAYLHIGSESTGPMLQFDAFVKSCDSLRENLEQEIFNVYQFRPECLSKVESLYSDLFRSLLETVGEFSVYTTNYDRVIEEFCGSQRMELVDGFRADQYARRNLWNPSTLDEPWDLRQIKLFKLHCSLNWRSGAYGIEQVMPEDRLGGPTPVYEKNLLIYPGSKDPPESEPFRTIHDRFETQMREDRVCLVIGFSFRDPYLNRIFRDFVQSKDSVLISMGVDSARVLAQNLLNSQTELNKYIDNKSVLTVTCNFGEQGWLGLLREAVSATLEHLQGVIETPRKRTSRRSRPTQVR